MASVAAEAFFLVHPPLPSWTSWLRVRPPHPARIIPKDPEIGGDMTLEFKKTAPITPNLLMSNQLATKATLKSAAFSRVFPGFLRASQRLFSVLFSDARAVSHGTTCPRESYVEEPLFDPLCLISRLMCLRVSYLPRTRPLTPLCGPLRLRSSPPICVSLRIPSASSVLRALGEGRG
jgi:hypothetical protein